jgi:hypothetical protein
VYARTNKEKLVSLSRKSGKKMTDHLPTDLLALALQYIFLVLVPKFPVEILLI